MANNEYLNKDFLNNYGTNWLFDVLTPNTGSLTFKAIPEELIEINNVIVIRPAWNNNEEILKSIYTSSEQTELNFKDYTLNIYSDDSCAEQTKQFTIEYGHFKGYGTSYEYITEKTSTNAIYKKYRLLLDDSDLENYSHFYALKFNNIETQDSLYSEFFSIKITNPLTQSIYSSLINYDYFTSQSSYEYIDYDVIRLASGSLETGIYYENGLPVFFGKLYPKQSIVILNVDSLNTYTKLNVQTGSNINENNTVKLYSSISSSIYKMNQNEFKYWSLVNLKKTKQVLSMPIRILPTDFNYSTNPTFYEENGKIKTNLFNMDPTTFFTTIGLYNSKYELLAIAKISKPLQKNFREQFAFEVTIEIK